MGTQWLHIRACKTHDIVLICILEYTQYILQVLTFVYSNIIGTPLFYAGIF